MKLVMYLLLSVYSLHACQESALYKLSVQYGISGRKGRRERMEDLCTATFSEAGSLFCLFDGHGGISAAREAKRLLPTYLSTKGEKDAYCTVDQAIRNIKTSSGTTALTARIQSNEDGTHQLILGWVGDSRALLVDAHGNVKCATTDHKPENKAEYERVINAGGNIFTQTGKTRSSSYRTIQRVEHPKQLGTGISLTRSLGDRDWSPDVISPEPEILTLTLQPNEDAYVIFACDGVWDVMGEIQAAGTVHRQYKALQLCSESDITKLILNDTAHKKDNWQPESDGNHYGTMLTARELRDMAYKLGSGDNITVLVARLIWEKKQQLNNATNGSSNCVIL